MSGVDYVEDPIQQLVRIIVELASGAIVVMVQELVNWPTVGGARYRGIPDPAHPPQAWSTISDGDLTFYSQSYRLLPDPRDPTKNIPTYLVGASAEGTYGIERSVDGQHWETVYSAGSSRRQRGFVGLTWHPDHKLFYGFTYTVEPEGTGGGDVRQTAQILSSPDGIGWAVIDSISAIFGPDTPSFDPIMQHFRDLCVKPENRGGIPDGIQAYDPKSGIFMKPAGDLHWDLNGMGWPIRAEGLTIEGSTGPTTSPPGVGWLVSFAGGVWNAVMYDIESPGDARPTKIYVSTDNGRSWQLTFETAGWYPGGLIAGAAADVIFGGTP